MSIYKALLEVQKELEPVKRTSDNPFFHSKYADLEAVVGAVTPILNKHGVVAVQYTKWLEKGPAVYTELVDVESGERTITELPIICKDSSDPQKVIAGLTCMRRASLACACGLATQDDDGNSAAGREKDEKKAYKQPEPIKKVVVPQREDGGSPQKAPNSQFTPKGVVYDSEQKQYKYKITTEKSGDYFTEKEVLAKIAKQNLGKPLDIRMTVDNEMRNILLDIILF